MESYLEFSEERNQYAVKELVTVRLCEVSSIRDKSSSHKHIPTHGLQPRLQFQLSLRPTHVFCLKWENDWVNLNHTHTHTNTHIAPIQWVQNCFGNVSHIHYVTKQQFKMHIPLRPVQRNRKMAQKSLRKFKPHLFAETTWFGVLYVIQWNYKWNYNRHHKTYKWDFGYENWETHFPQWTFKYLPYYSKVWVSMSSTLTLQWWIKTIKSEKKKKKLICICYMTFKM